MKIALVPAVLAVLLAAAPAAGQVPSAADLRKVADQYAAAWAKGDAAGLASHYTDDAVFVTVEGTVLKGRPAIQQDFQTDSQGMWKGTTITIATGQIVSVQPNVAVSEGTFTVQGAKDPSGKPMPMTGRYMNTWVMRNGRWMIASNAAFVPAPAPPSR